ncbi:MAG: hypothetical protein HC802_19450 [Caldilineaceae bacterium]|nr:hypothetical protein [Caldilineaceae bacterium]
MITLRADFYANCAQFDNLRIALEGNQKFIGAMTRDELRRAIELPMARGNWEFEPGLVELLLDDVEDEPGALPLLSHALLETWKRRRGRMLTFASYQASGRVQGAIAQTADNVLAQRMTEEQQPIVRNIFLRLTELGEGAQDTRRRVARSELVPQNDPEQAATVEAVLTTLIDARLVTVYSGEVEVAHEALIREWPTLRTWLTEDRDALRVHRRLTEAAIEWQTLNKDKGALLRGVRLQQAQEWAKGHEADLNDLERSFMRASLAAVEAALPATDLLVFSDFNYGVLPQKLVDAIIALAAKAGVPAVAEHVVPVPEELHT